jgi:hypothetical protein
MSSLPKNTSLGQLEIIEVYEYYDQPLLFACQNASSVRYLVVLEDEDDDSETWLYATISPTRHQQIRSGGIDLYSAFKQAEDGFVFVVQTFHDESISSDFNLVSVDELTEEQLPEQGEALNLATETLEKATVSVERRASQLLREYIEVALEFPGQKRNEAPISVLSNIMKNLQDTLVSFGHTISDIHKNSINPTKDLIQKMELSLLDVSAGSFRLEMASSEQSDMFGDTLIGDSLAELSRLIALGSDEEALENAFQDYKPSVPKQYLKLLSTISNSRIDTTNLRWASANGQRGGEMSLLIPMVNRTIDTINEMVVRETNFINVTGTLTGAFTGRRFEIETSDNTYDGKLDNEALSVEASNVINNARLGNRYKVRLREVITRRIAADKIGKKYYLIDVEEYTFQ